MQRRMLRQLETNEPPPVEEKTAGDEVEQWFSNDDLLSESDAEGNQVED